jgi:hypothetical protein
VIWLGLAACLAWAVLLLGRGLFWLARDDAVLEVTNLAAHRKSHR